MAAGANRKLPLGIGEHILQQKCMAAIRNQEARADIHLITGDSDQLSVCFPEPEAMRQHRVKSRMGVGVLEKRRQKVAVQGIAPVDRAQEAVNVRKVAKKLVTSPGNIFGHAGALPIGIIP